MKTFSNVQELWDYCNFCPICLKNVRPIRLSVGPDTAFELNSFEKSPDFLDISCSFTNKLNVYSMNYRINCLTNNFDVDIVNVLMDNPRIKVDKQKVKEAYFYFYIQSHCPECTWAWSYGTDLELDMLERKVSNIALEREFFYIFEEKDKYEISIFYDRNIMLVSRIKENEDGSLGEASKSIELPLVRLDLSNLPKVINKIKTLILFS